MPASWINKIRSWRPHYKCIQSKPPTAFSACGSAVRPPLCRHLLWMSHAPRIPKWKKATLWDQLTQIHLKPARQSERFCVFCLKQYVTGCRLDEVWRDYVYDLVALRTFTSAPTHTQLRDCYRRLLTVFRQSAAKFVPRCSSLTEVKLSKYHSS